MSSNIKVQRICQHCGKLFTARTTVTRYCGDTCAKRAYKSRLRDEKVNKANTETMRIINQPMEVLKTKEFLTVTEVAKLISCSRQNVYKLINSGKLRATNILEKKTIIRRCDIEALFTEVPDTGTMPEKHKQELNEWKQAGQFEITDCYTLKEVHEKYDISERALYELIIREGIPKIKKGWYTYVPQNIIDALLGVTT